MLQATRNMQAHKTRTFKNNHKKGRGGEMKSKNSFMALLCIFSVKSIFIHKWLEGISRLTNFSKCWAVVPPPHTHTQWLHQVESVHCFLVASHSGQRDSGRHQPVADLQTDRITPTTPTYGYCLALTLILDCRLIVGMYFFFKIYFS